MVDGAQALDCFENLTCTEGELCLKTDGDCGGSGTCSRKTRDCAGVLEPGCGCDGQAYSNRCLAHSAGVNVAHGGRCDVSPSQLLLEVSPTSLNSCTDLLTLIARVLTADGIPVPGAVVVFDETPASTLMGRFVP